MRLENKRRKICAIAKRGTHIRQRVDVSMPLESDTTGTLGGTRSATFSSAARENCIGTARKMKSASANAGQGRESRRLIQAA